MLPRRPSADTATQRAARSPVVQASAVTAALLGVPCIAQADPVFTAPSGVAQYRLIFVTTDSIDSLSPDISYYNTFATSEAALNSALPATTWTAVVSTETVNAADNVSCGLSCDSSVPIYLVDGTTLVAASTDALFGGAISAAPDQDQSGDTDNTYAWTGSIADGTTQYGPTGTPHAMGDAYTEVGDSAFQGTQFLDAGYSLGTTGNDLPIYAISGVIETGAADVPEPASSAALLAAGLVVTNVFRRRRPHA